MSLIFKVFAE